MTLGAVIFISIAVFGADMTLSPSWSACVDIGKEHSGTVSGTMNMIGVTSDAITSGPHKDAGSPFRKMQPEERELFQQIVNEMKIRGYVRKTIDNYRGNLVATPCRSCSSSHASFRKSSR